MKRIRFYAIPRCFSESVRFRIVDHQYAEVYLPGRQIHIVDSLVTCLLAPKFSEAIPVNSKFVSLAVLKNPNPNNIYTLFLRHGNLRRS